MTTNPLKGDNISKRGVVTVEKLQDMADSLNREHFVQAMGRHYHVVQEPKGDGTMRHALVWKNVKAA